MKLIDLIVKHVPREQIPIRANYFVQDQGEYHETWGFVKEPYFREEDDWNSEYGATFELKGVPVAEDAGTTVITRDELMYAYDMAEITKVHFDTVAQREQILCIFPVGGSPDISIDVSQDSEVSVENEWLTVRHAGQLVCSGWKILQHG